MGKTDCAKNEAGHFGRRGNGANAMLSPTALQAALDTVMAASLQPVAAVLSALYTVFAVSHALILPRPVATPMTGVAAGTAATFLGLYFILRWRPLPSAWAHPLGA